MMKKSQGSSARGAQAGKKEKGMKSKKIDFSDIPELSDKQLSVHASGRSANGGRRAEEDSSQFV